jgi:hypothetical protein
MTPEQAEAAADSYIKSCEEPEDDDIHLHPMQEVVRVGKVARFRENKLVSLLLEVAGKNGTGLNEIALMNAKGLVSDADAIQLMQLIGYSVSGYGDLTYIQRHATKALMPADQAVMDLPPYEVVERLAGVADED